MKIALYIEDGCEQIVLTPESLTETAILAKLTDGERKVSIYSGAFYGCRGGWKRWSDPPAATGITVGINVGRQADQSAIIVLSEKAPCAS